MPSGQLQIAENAKQISSYAAVTLASAATFLGAAVDCSGYDEATYIEDIGVLVGAGCTINAKITECATSGGSYSDITGAAFAAAVVTTNNNQSFMGRCRVDPAKPFQKVSVTSSGTVTGAPLAITLLLHKSKGLRHPLTTPSFQVT